MATWIAHLRIAESLLNKGLKFEKIPFVSGNIAPDAGIPNEDYSVFSPPPAITHWKDEEGKLKAEDFYKKYIAFKSEEEDKEKLSFLLGYYTHLLTDIEWGKLYRVKKEEPAYREGLGRDRNFIWEIKEDWYGLDFLYLKENEKNIFSECFQHITEVEDYLDYFPEGAFTARFEYIRNYYLGKFGDSIDPDRNYIYLTKEEMDKFVNEASENIKKQLLEKDALKKVY